MKWILAEDIVNWVERKPRDAQQNLPRFIKKLIRSQVDSNATVEIPDGEGTADHGWDGVVSFDGHSSFVPSGRSLWEIGTSRQVKTKADNDFDDRASDPLGELPETSTFVFVSPRKWEGKKSWVSDKKGGAVWKDVRALNARDLEDWFEAAPAVAREFALHIGKYAGEIRSLEEFWREWSAATDPPISTDLLLAGREHQADELKSAFKDDAVVLTINGETVDEAVGFVYATVSEFSEHESDQALTRTVICENEDSVRSTVLVQENLVVVLASPHASLVGSLLDSDKSVIVVDYIRANQESNGITLEVPWRSEFEKALCKAGLAEEVALQVAAQTGTSISAYRRLQPVGQVPIPGTWDASHFADAMVPAVLAGQWVQREDNLDSEILEKLALKPESVAENKLRKLLELEAAPLRREGELWVLTSPSEAFLAVGPYITESHLEKFEEVALRVLTEMDPRFELEESERHAASIYGKTRQYSGRLRRGLAQALCLVSTRLQSVSGTDGEVLSTSIVRRVFQSISENSWIGWASISDVSPWLAEAAPSEFLTSVENALKDDHTTFSQLMTDEDGFLGTGACLHAGLLWALESLAWFPEHLPRTALVLAKLAEIDPGGRWGNRPAASLVDVFLTWKNHSTAPVERKLAVIDQVCEKHNEVGWALLKGLGNSQFTNGTHQPKWRTVSPLTFTVSDYSEYRNELRKIYLRVGWSSPDHLADVIDGESILTKNEYVQSIQKAGEIDIKCVDTDIRMRLRRSVRRRLYRIRSFSKPTDVDEDVVSALLAAYEHLSDVEPIERHRWLFEADWPELPSGERRNHEKYRATIEDERRHAVREILDTVGIGAAIALAEDADFYGRFAAVLGTVLDPERASTALSQIGDGISDDYPLDLVCFACGCRIALGDEWIRGQIRRIGKEPHDSRVCAALLLALENTRQTWDFASTLGPEIEGQYWKWVSVRSDGENSEFAVTKLLEAGRVFDALDICAINNEAVSSSTIVTIIQRVIVQLSQPEDSVTRNLSDYHLEELFECLDSRNDVETSETASLEFPFSILFEHTKRGVSSNDQLVLENPAYFAELVSWAYKPDNDGEDHERIPDGWTKEQIANRAQNAYHLLEALRFVPGRGVKSFDSIECVDWITRCVEHLDEFGRAEIGSHWLAEVIQRTPVGDDGIWPDAGIRSVVESLCSDKFCASLHAAFFNARGATSRSLDEGGIQERKLVEEYRSWADAIDIETPRIASVLRQLAKTYMRHASDEDVDARARRLGD